MNIFVIVVIVKTESRSADSQNRRHFKNISANFALFFSVFFFKLLWIIIYILYGLLNYYGFLGQIILNV